MDLIPKGKYSKLNYSNNMDKNLNLAEVANIITKFKEIDSAYLFGSFLKKDESNDIDLALLLSEELVMDSYKSLKLSLRIASELERKIKPRFEFDVKILNTASIELQFEIIKKGKAIFSRDESRRIDYEADLISTYLDLKYMYDLLDKEFLARI